jgi:hypothetical protein
MNALMRVMCAVLVTGLSAVLADSASATKILFHGREASPVRGDVFAVAHLKSIHGDENVTYMKGTDAAMDGSDANGFDVVVLSSSMASSNARGKYEDSPVGVVAWENALIKAGDPTPGNFFLSADAKNLEYNVLTFPIQIDIVDESHPLAAGLSGTVDVLVDDNSTLVETGVQYGLGPLGDGVDQIATWTVDTEERQMIFAADVGAALLGDGVTEDPPGFTSPATAAGRRVFFFLSDYGFDRLTADGLALFDAAINWTANQLSLGDVNGDGTVNGLDVDPFVDVLLNGPYQAAADMNEDGEVNGLDVDPFVAAVVGGGVAAVPEPSTLLLCLIALGLVTGRRKWQRSA